MLEKDQIRPGAILPIVKEGSGGKAFMKVQIVPGDGRVIVSLVGDREHPLITSEDVILGGGVIDGATLGRFVFSPYSTEGPDF